MCCGVCAYQSVYCRKCIKCQQAKLPTPIHAPMNSIPIGRTWQMIAVDILEVPVSKKKQPLFNGGKTTSKSWQRLYHFKTKQLFASLRS